MNWKHFILKKCSWKISEIVKVYSILESPWQTEVVKLIKPLFKSYIINWLWMANVKRHNKSKTSIILK